VEDSSRIARYLRPDELHQAFNFEYLTAPWEAGRLREVIDSSLAANGAVGATTTWVLSNHDVTRHVTRFGGGEQGLRRAHAATLLMLALPGSVYLYQGEELGLPEVVDLPEDALQDPTWLRSGGTDRGRDGCRVALPWKRDVAWFWCCPQTARPWLPVPQSWGELARGDQRGTEGSTLELYTRAPRPRRERDALGDGPLTRLSAPTGVLFFEREPGTRCAVNL